MARVLYYPYGETRWLTGTLTTDYGFTGQRKDYYTQLYQMGARWYDPQIGRWISPDTIVPDYANPQSLNRFAYVRNNPLRYIDPTGHIGHEPPKPPKPPEPPPGCEQSKACMEWWEKTHGGQGSKAMAVEQNPEPPPPDDQAEREQEDGDGHLDAVGWRLEGSAGAVIGIDLNIDAVLNLNDQETGEWKGGLYALLNWDENFDIFVSVALQGPDVGVAASTGPLFIDNMPFNEQKLEPGWYFFVTGAYEEAVEVNYRLSEYNELYIGGGLGLEGAIGFGHELFVVNATDIVFELFGLD